MDIVTREDLNELVERQAGPCLSIYQPTHRVGPDTRTYAQQDPIRFKNLLREAEQRLTASGLRSREAEDLLEPARRLLDDPVFWQYQSDGLAVFLATGTVRTFRVPLRFDELVVVAPSFHVKPLLALLTGDGLFYVLALSQNEIRLLAGTRDHMGEVELPGAPPSLAEALRYDDPERQLQFHTGTSAGGDRRAAMFHGHGTGIDDAKGNLLRFFQQVDRALVNLIGDASVPLVLAAVDYLMPIYREANTRPVLLGEGIAGNPEGLRADELHARAWPLVEPQFRRGREEATARYLELKGTGRTSNEVREVVPAAWDGRVDVLFVAVGVRIWGTFASDTRTIEIGDEAPGQSEDVLNLAAIHTVLNRGTVYAVPPAEMPDETPAAAVLRY
jgi:Bacterial archaeo-eukaryotic release factor family 7